MGTIDFRTGCDLGKTDCKAASDRRTRTRWCCQPHFLDAIGRLPSGRIDSGLALDLREGNLDEVAGVISAAESYFCKSHDESVTQGAGLIGVWRPFIRPWAGQRAPS